MTPGEKVQAYYGLFTAPSRETLDAIVHDDFALDDDPFDWHIRGKEALWKTVDREPLLKLGEFVCDAYHGDEESGATHWVWDVGPQFSGIYGLPAGDQRAHLEGVAVVTFREGKLASLKEHWDSASLLRQFGVALPDPNMG